MRALRAWIVRLRGALTPGRRDRDFADELESHLHLHIDDNLRAGMTPEEARRQALIKLGGLEQAKEAYRSRGTIPALDEWIRDLRQGCRSLVRAPWYSVTAIAVVALSMTLASTVFAVVDGVLFKPLPMPHPEELYVVNGPFGYAASVRDVREWADAVPEARIAIYQGTFDMGAIGAERPRRVVGAGIGSEFLTVLGMRPILGGFAPAHFEPAVGPVPALISHALWQEHFGGSAEVVGAAFEMAGAVDHLRVPISGVTIAGVLPPDFVFPHGQEDAADLLVPLAPRPEDEAERNWGKGRALMRLPAGVAVDAVQARLTAVASRQEFPTSRRPGAVFRIGVDPIGRELRYAFGREFEVVFTMATVILALGCVNVSGLAIARQRQRSREYAMRLALGASDWRISRLAICEAAPLAAAGTSLGLFLAAPAVSFSLQYIPSYIVLVKPPAIDWRVAAFGAVGALLAVLVSVLTQRWTRPLQLSSPIQNGGIAVVPGRGRASAVLAAVQVALAFGLSIGGTLVVGSYWWAWRQDPGYPYDRVALLEVNLGTGEYQDLIRRSDDLLREIRQVEGVESVAAVGGPFLSGSWSPPAIQRPAGAARGREQQLWVTSEFFSLMKFEPSSGRLPTESEFADPINAPFAVVSERMAQALWAGESAIGKVLVSERGDRESVVIGVVPDAKYVRLDAEAYGQVYWPYGPWGRSASVLIQSRGVIRQTLREAVTRARVVPGVGVVRAVTGEEALGDSIRLRAFRAWVFGGFAAAALGVAAVGLFGLTAMSTARRRREMGLRRALGASRAAVVASLVKEHMPALAVGLLFGGLAASWAVQFVRPSLYQFTGQDVRLWGPAAVVVLLAAGSGVLLPALKASRADPMTALRVD